MNKKIFKKHATTRKVRFEGIYKVLTEDTSQCEEDRKTKNELHLRHFDQKAENKLLNLTDRKLQKLHNFDVLNDSRRVKQLFSHFESSIVEPNLANIEYLKHKNTQRKQLIEDLLGGTCQAGSKWVANGTVKFDESVSDEEEFGKGASSIIAPNKSTLGRESSKEEETRHKEQFLKYLKRKINYVEPKYTKIEETLVDKNKREKQRQKELLHLGELYNHGTAPGHLKSELSHLFEQKPVGGSFQRKKSVHLAEVRERKWTQGKYDGVHKVVYQEGLLAQIKEIFDKLDDHKTLVVSVKKLVSNLRRNDHLRPFMGKAVLGFVEFGSFGEIKTESESRGRIDWKTRRQRIDARIRFCWGTRTRTK